MPSEKYLFIAGAPKSGTSFLFELLSSNNDILCSKVKETNYFLDEGHPLLNEKKNFHKDGLGAFDSFFQGRDAWRLEASVHMMNQTCPLENLMQLGDVKIIFLLREPASRIYSSFLFSKNNLNLFKNPDFCFEDFVAILKRGDLNELGKEMRAGIRPDVLMGELSMGCYALHIREWIRGFEKKNIRLLQYEKFMEDVETELTVISDWLGIDGKGFVFEFNKVVNPTRKIGDPQFHMVLKKWMPNFLRTEFLKKIYFAWQDDGLLEASKKDEVVIRALKEYYIPYNLELKKIMGLELDLKYWE